MFPTKGKVIKCKAAVVWEEGQPMVMEQVEVAPPKANEIRVKLVAAGVCRSDLSGWTGALPGVRYPVILGHEGSGIVESVGENITSVKEGDHVLTNYLPECGDCKICKGTKSNLCIKYKLIRQNAGFMVDGTTNVTCKGKTIYKFIGVSSYMEYTVLEHAFFAKIPKEAPLEKVCLLSCGITTGYGAPLNVAKVTPGSTCAVFGLGAVGLGSVMGCRIQGAKRIFGVDINNEKREIAKTIGVTDFINPKDYDKPIEQVLVEMTDGGCDYTFECIGIPGIINSALASCNIEKGQCTLIGVCAKGTTVSVDPFLLLWGRVISGCFFGGFKTSKVPGLVNDYMKKKIMVDEFITEVLPIDKVNEAFDNLIKGKTLKTVLKF